MPMHAGTSGHDVFDLEAIELHPAPKFVIKTGPTALDFDLLYGNEAFRTGELRSNVLDEKKEALLFRSWAQSLSGHGDVQHEFAGWTWSAQLPMQGSGLKVVSGEKSLEKGDAGQARTGYPNTSFTDRSHVYTPAKEGFATGMDSRARSLSHSIPRTNIIARWEGIQAMMEMSDVGVFEYNTEGKLLHANEAWYKLSSHPRDLPAHVNFSFMDLVHPDDQSLVMSMWNKLAQGTPVTFEMRWKSHGYVLSACVPIFDEDHVLISIAGNTIDIADQKKTQEAIQARVEALEQARVSEMKLTRLQHRRVQEALEAKRQQENFIDMTSHELRNPLSAVVQCAELVIAELQRLLLKPSKATGDIFDPSVVQEELSSSLDALQTIVSCSMHQKRVIDDVLTLSKLDSDLIIITPVRVRPTVVVSDAIKMFVVECQQMDIQLGFVEDESIKQVEWVMLDPSRLLQILINLLTNAIKFTKERPIRKITVKLGASWERPPPIWHAISFTSASSKGPDIFNQSEWGAGRMCHLWIKVIDTGCGMTEDEQKNLFSRFTQASPRTHVKYGGSGLGLFISKSLTTLLGGGIGVASASHVGSTFAFFVGTRLAEPPADHVVGRASQETSLVDRTCDYQIAMNSVKLNVLIVEDNLVNQRVLKKQLDKCGWTVHVAGNGQEALDWLKRSIFWRNEHEAVDGIEFKEDCQPKAELDIILLDIEMPIMDGLTCARRIREYEKRGLLGLPPSASGQQRPLPSDERSAPIQNQKFRLPLLAVSANARVEQIQEAVAAGMDDAITKPFRIPEIWPKITSLIPRLSSTGEGKHR
ncbi:hypothetical protein HBH98_069180 [Parastagonospora nodorum]|nr:hypothetical protein HBH51_038780 [Parastagonospora nodorum]KAH3983158.1 hypothetical protein HBH52_066390 [Parastagonospora nodorum]KAH4024334.1 hypothetical protein HBI09_159250 [Parastagonospora nodorum]KAH4182773.1 hypothetical protein HBH42_213650 [Parastagonospora nodorum]KAH4264419.1 hypothetical protein HBI03_093590 [Parastagonospora nodorum]